jgi:chromosome segregation ATPase
MKRKSVDDENINTNININTYANSSNDDVVFKLKESVRLQAIELTSLRQEILSKRLQTNKEIDSLREQLDSARREVIKVNATARTHKGDKEIKMNEMAVTIKTLSARGDMHTQLVAARQELEAEKMTCHHLRADIDVYRTMLETEQTKAIAIRKDLATVTSTLESVNVLETIMDVPGVEPAALIEAMSGQIIQLHADYSKTRS